MQLWSSRHLASGLVALAVVEGEDVHPARGPASMPRSVRVVDEATAELVEKLLREHAATAAGREVWVDLDTVIARAESARHQQH